MTVVPLDSIAVLHEGASSASNACRLARGDGLIGTTRAHDAVSTSGMMWPSPSYVSFLAASGTPPHEMDLRESASHDEFERILQLAESALLSAPTRVRDIC